MRAISTEWINTADAFVVAGVLRADSVARDALPMLAIMASLVATESSWLYGVPSIPAKL